MAPLLYLSYRKNDYTGTFCSMIKNTLLYCIYGNTLGTSGTGINNSKVSTQMSSKLLQSIVTQPGGRGGMWPRVFRMYISFILICYMAWFASGSYRVSLQLSDWFLSGRHIPIIIKSSKIVKLRFKLVTSKLRNRRQCNFLNIALSVCMTVLIEFSW
jgi:hypothetical protein